MDVLPGVKDRLGTHPTGHPIGLASDYRIMFFFHIKNMRTKFPQHLFQAAVKVKMILSIGDNGQLIDRKGFFLVVGELFVSLLPPCIRND